MNLVPLPAALNLAAVPVAAIASAVLAFLSTVGLPEVPGFRPVDASRNSLMRVLLGVLNVAGLTLYAWTQGIILVPAQLVTLVATVVVAVGGGHVVYTLIKAGSNAGSGNAASVPALPAPTVPSVAALVPYTPAITRNSTDAYISLPAQTPPLASVPVALTVPSVPPLPSDPTPLPVPAAVPATASATPADSAS